jgi:hypothetical protein
MTDPNEAWRPLLILTPTKKPRPLLANAIIALREAPAWHGVLAYNEFRRESDSIDPDQKIHARAVARRYSISVRTLDRWLRKPHLSFPQPDMVTRDVTGRVANRYWRLGDLIAWERTQAVNHAEAA